MSGATTTSGRVENVDMKLEVVVIPVSDVDRAKEFYARLGWRLDVTPPIVVQFTPHGSGCSVQFGATLTSAAPGSAHGVPDRLRHRGGPGRAGRRRHRGERGLPPRSGRPGQRAGSRAPQLLLARLVQRSGRQRLAAAGGHDAASRARRGCRDVVRLRQRPGERDAARGGRPRRAREAHRRRQMRTGPTGTPSTWSASRRARSRRREGSRRERSGPCAGAPPPGWCPGTPGGSLTRGVRPGRRR